MKSLALLLCFALLRTCSSAAVQAADAAASAKSTEADIAAIPSALGSLEDFFRGFSRARGVEWLKRDASGAVYACASAPVGAAAGDKGFFEARDKALEEALGRAAEKLRAAGFVNVGERLCTVCCAERQSGGAARSFAIGAVVKLDAASQGAFDARNGKMESGLSPRAWAQGGSFVPVQLMGTRFFYGENGYPAVLAFGQEEITGACGGGSVRREAAAEAVKRAGEKARRNIERFAGARGAKVDPKRIIAIEEGTGTHPGGPDFAYSVMLWNGGPEQSGRGVTDSAAKPVLFDF